MARLVRPIRLIAAATLASLVMTPIAQAQGFDLRSIFKLPGSDAGGATTGTVPASPPGSGPDWSGESGASGHPLMTAEAIRSAAANFHGCLEQLAALAERRGVPRGAV